MLNTIIGFLVVAGGGAVGAMLRHAVNMLSLKALGPDFPWGTLIVNVIGSFAMGALIVVFAHILEVSNETRLFLVTGMLGAFTTFSAFSLDFAVLWERGALMPAAAYMLASVVLSIAALFTAMALMRQLYA